jgi:hypothetical protein
VAFIGLAAAGAMAFVLLWVAMPETRPSPSGAAREAVA